MAVIDNNFETKGSHLFFIDTVTASEPEVVKLTCPTGITGVGGGTADTIDTTCLDETGKFRTNITGFADTQDLSVPFILYKGDGSHQALFPLRDSGQKVGWFIGLSDADSVPTMDSDMSDLVPPVNRTGFTFRGSVSNVTIDIATNEVVRGTITIKPSGETVPHWAV